jgi:hypothetical protein
LKFAINEISYLPSSKPAFIKKFMAISHLLSFTDRQVAGLCRLRMALRQKKTETTGVIRKISPAAGLVPG